MPQKSNPWNEVFKTQGTFFTDPHEDMPDVVTLLRKEKARRVLDLGSGSGRHVVYLAQHGFSVFGFDKSEEGLDITREWLKREGLEADLRSGEMTVALPYEDDFFDAVLSIQVIYHAVLTDITRTVDEIKRVLKTSGLIFITFPSLRNQGRKYEEIEPGTFIPLDGMEKGLPHHYFTPDTFGELFKDFEITDIHVDKVDHYAVTGFKR
jgi:tellurite methyltransferase